VSVTAEGQDVPREIDTSRPHSARVYDYMIGGKNHFEADREAARGILEVLPTGNIGPRENRGFLRRAIRYLAAEAGIRQFLDIGTGLPTTSNVHEVAQQAAPSSRIVYVDNDPLVLVHAQALLTSAPEGRTAYIEEDLRRPEAILSHPVTREVLDFGQPLGLVIAGVLHFVVDADGPAAIVATLVDALPSASYVVASHITPEHSPQGTGAAQRSMRGSGIPVQPRESDEFARLAFSGLDLVPPGVTLVSEWRPDQAGPRPAPAEVGCYGGVGRKP
jgi:S-adenosyl methyltransferase